MNEQFYVALNALATNRQDLSGLTKDDCSALVDFFETLDELEPVRRRLDPYSFPRRELYLGRVIVPLLREYFRLNRTISVEALLRQYLSKADGQQNAGRYLVLVGGLGATAPLRVGPDWVFRPATDDDLADWRADGNAVVNGVLREHPASCLERNFSIGWEAEAPGERRRIEASAREGLEFVKMLLSVVGGVDLRERCALVQYSTVPFGRYWQTSEDRSPGLPHVLSAPNQEEIDKLWDALTVGSNREKLTFAVRRFASALARTEAADRLVDCWIILESIFSNDSKELSHKVSFRAAVALFGGEGALNQYEFLKSSYDLRSSIVHGSTSEKTKKKLAAIEEHFGFLQEVTRLGIVALAGQPARFNPASLDETVLRRTDVYHPLMRGPFTRP